MIEYYTNSTSGIELSPSDRIQFYNKGVGCSRVQTPINSITLRESGIYLVLFNASIASNGDTGMSIKLSLYEDGVSSNVGVSEVFSYSSKDIESASFATLVRVRNSCSCVDNTKEISVVYDGVSDALLYNANIIIKKVS